MKKIGVDRKLFIVIAVVVVLGILISLLLGDVGYSPMIKRPGSSLGQPESQLTDACPKDKPKATGKGESDSYFIIVADPPNSNHLLKEQCATRNNEASTDINAIWQAVHRDPEGALPKCERELANIRRWTNADCPRTCPSANNIVIECRLKDDPPRISTRWGSKSIYDSLTNSYTEREGCLATVNAEAVGYLERTCGHILW